MGLTICWITMFGLALVERTDGQSIPPLDAVRVTNGLSSAVFVTAPPGDYNRIFIVRQSGEISILNLQNGTIKTFLDLSSGFNLRYGGEQGLLGMAFDPDYNNAGSDGYGKFYVDFVVTGGTWGEGRTHISQFQVDPNDADKALTTEHLLMMPRPSPSPAVPLTFDHPLSNHNAGWIGFSPRAGDDHNLYVSAGDGGNSYDQDPAPTPTPPGHIEPGGNAQDYDRNTGGTVIGGYVYRGRQIPGLTGTYVFGDYLAHKIFVLNYNGATASNFTDITTTQLFPTATADTQDGLTLSGFGEDANGELYFTDVGNGNVFKIVPTAPNVVMDSVNKSVTTFSLHGFGVPFKAHTVQAVDSITQSFSSQTTIGTASAGGDGGFQFPESNVTATTRFYRVTYP